MARSQCIFITLILLLGLSGNIFFLEAKTLKEPDFQWDWEIITQTSVACRILNQQCFEATSNIFLERTIETGRNDWDHGDIRYTYVKGINGGVHAGYRAAGLNVGYGYFAGWPHRGFFTTGWNASLMLDHVYNGNGSLRDKKNYAGLEIEGALFFLNMSVGMKYCLEGKDDPVLMLGTGLRF